MRGSDVGHVQIEFSASSKGLRCSPQLRLIPKLQVDVGRMDLCIPKAVVTPDIRVPDMTFTRDLVCSYTGFAVGPGSPAAGTRVEQAEGSQLFEARAVLAKYYHRPKRLRENYVTLLRGELSASDLNDDDDSAAHLGKIIQQQQQTMAIGRGICTALARRLAHQACWLPVWSCGRLMVGIARLAIARLIPQLLLGLQGVRPVK